MFINVYLFDCWVLVGSHRIFDLCCAMLGASVVACELLAAACVVQFPDQGSDLGTLPREGRVVATKP